MLSSRNPLRFQPFPENHFFIPGKFRVRLALTGLCLLLSTPLFAGEPRTVWLANGVDSERYEVICILGAPVGFPLPGLTDNQPLPPGELATVQAKTSQYLADAGISNVVISDVEPPEPDITVHFQGYRECLDGVAVDGVDQYDEVKTGERVVMFANTPDFWIPQDLARDLAHEIGHTFGLSHILPTNEQDPTKESIMDNRYPGHCGGGCTDDRYLDEPIAVNVFFYEENQTHNPTYHLRRYVGGESNLDIQASGVCPGDYDLNPPGFFEQQVRLVVDLFGDTSPDGPGDGPGGEIFDLMVVADEGGDALRVVERIDSASSGEPLVIRFAAETGQPFQLFASSVDGGPPDILLAGDTDPAGTAELFPSEIGNSSLRLLKQVGDDAYEQVGTTIVSGLAGALLKDSFENLVPGRAQGENPASDPDGTVLLPQCIQTRLIGAYVDGAQQRLYPWRIDAATGDVDSLDSTVIGTPGWTPNSLRVDAERGFFYARSSNNVLFQFDLGTGEMVNSSPVSGNIQVYDIRSDGFLAGVGYDSGSGQNFIAQINPATGALSVLNNVAFPSGYFGDTVTIDRTVGVLWVVSPASTLYEFDAFTGEQLRTVGISNTPSAMAVKADGNLIGVGYNGPAGHFFVVAIDYLTGDSVVLNTFNLSPAGAIMGRLSVDPLTERMYVASTDGLILVFDVNTGALLDEVFTGPAFQGVRVIENLATE